MKLFGLHILLTDWETLSAEKFNTPVDSTESERLLDLHH